MAEPIIFTITEAGKQAALSAQADSAQLKINLTQVAVGTGKRTVTGAETALLTEVKRGGIVSGDVEVNSNTLRFTSSMSGSAKTDVYEIGLFTDASVLFALASSSTTPLFSLHPDVTFVIALGLSLSDVAADSVTVTTDPGGALSVVIMEQHLAAPDPHPQYVLGEVYDQHVVDNDLEHKGITGNLTEFATLESLLNRIKVLEEAPAPFIPMIPIGGVFETTIDYKSPAKLAEAIGYGSWARFAEGRTTVGLSSKASDAVWTKTMGSEYGEDTHTLTEGQSASHSHTVSQTGSVTNKQLTIVNPARVSFDAIGVTVALASGSEKNTGASGSNLPHNNVQPSIVVGKWVRTA